jgi:hypothetical protein
MAGWCQRRFVGMLQVHKAHVSMPKASGVEYQAFSASLNFDSLSPFSLESKFCTASSSLNEPQASFLNKPHLTAACVSWSTRVVDLVARFRHCLVLEQPGAKVCFKKWASV